MNKTCQAHHKSTNGSLTRTNQKTIYTLKAHWQFKRLRWKITSKKFSKIHSLNGTPKLVNVLKSTFLGSEFHTFTIRSLKMLLLPEMHRVFYTTYIYDLEQKVAYLAQKISELIRSTCWSNAGPWKWRTKSHGWKMQDLSHALVRYFHCRANSAPRQSWRD